MIQPSLLLSALVDLQYLRPESRARDNRESVGVKQINSCSMQLSHIQGENWVDGQTIPCQLFRRLEHRQQRFRISHFVFELHKIIFKVEFLLIIPLKVEFLLKK